MTFTNLLNEFSSAINHCRAELSSIDVVEEDTFFYAILRIYSRVLLSCCEIFFLLKEKYPHGAMSLSRQVYEGLVIIDILQKGEKDRDTNMPVRFFDAAKIRALQYYLCLAKLVIENNPSDVEAQKTKDGLEYQLDE